MKLPDYLCDGKLPYPKGVAPIQAEVEVVTPMFLAGVDQQNIINEGPRSASIKGLLRWWWRATTKICDEKVMKLREGEIFGDTKEQNSGHGQGCLVRTRPVGQWRSSKPDIRDADLQYLLGMGLYNFKTGVLRPAVFAGERFILNITPQSEEHRLELKIALEAMLLFGGAGSRSRRGWGSFSKIHKDVQEVRSSISTLLENLPKGAKLWSHLSPHSIWHCEEATTWEQALKSVGSKMKNLRLKLGGQQAPYGPDHDLVSDFLHKSKPLARAPWRCAFGIPHNYFFKSSKKKVDFHWTDGDRRASPVILHVARCKVGFVSVALLLNGPFLPEGKGIDAVEYKDKTGHTRQPDFRAPKAYFELLKGGDLNMVVSKLNQLGQT